MPSFFIFATAIWSRKRANYLQEMDRLELRQIESNNAPDQNVLLSFAQPGDLCFGELPLTRADISPFKHFG